jgi:hypothetical protein
MLAGTAAPALALLVILGLTLFGSALLGGKVVSPSNSILFAPPFAAERPAAVTRASNPALNDLTTVYEDHLALARRAIRGGELPLWDAEIGAGRPLGGQGGPFYPTTWLAYMLPFWHSLGWSMFVKLLVAGLGMALFCHAIGLRRGPALLGAVTFAFSTLFVTYLGHGHTADFALAPWALLAAERLAVGARFSVAIALGIALGLALYSGHPETSLLLAILAYAYFAFRVLELRRSPDGSAEPWPRVGLGVAAGVLGLLIGALALVPLLSVVGEGMRLSRSGPQHVTLRDLFVGATLPEIWGRTDKAVFHTGSSQVFSVFFNGRVYVGVLPLLLGAVGFVRRPTPHQLFFAAVAALSLLAALGAPAHTILSHVPGLSLVGSFQYLWPMTVAVAVLAAFGAQRVLDGDESVARRGLFFGGVLALAGTVAALALRPHLLGHLAGGLRDVPTLRHAETSPDAAAAGSLVRFLLLTGAGLAVLMLAQRARWRRSAAIALVALSAGDLLLVDRGWWPAVPEATVAPAAPASLRAVQRSGPEWREAGLGVAFTPNLAERYGVLDARVDDVPELKRYSRLFARLGGIVLPGFGETVLLRIDAPQHKLLDLLATRWVLDSGPPAPVPTGLRAGLSRPGDRLLENPSAFPRAWIAYTARHARGLDDALNQVAAAPAASLREAPVVEGASPAATSAMPSTAATLQAVTADRVELAVAARAPGWLVLADTFYPGWIATVDGRAVPIRAANAAFRAVSVPAGAHRVVFRYEPGGILAAAWVSGLALVAALAALIGLALAGRHRRRHRDAVAHSDPVQRPLPT